MSNIHLISTHGPEFGHFFTTFALPVGSPDLLRGPNGEMAVKIGTAGTSASLYLMDCFAHLLTSFRRSNVQPALNPSEYIYDIPLAERPDLPKIDKWIHPAIVQNMQNLLPEVSYNDVRLDFTPFEPAGTSILHDDFVMYFKSNTHIVTARTRVIARSPIVQWWFAAQRRDGQADTTPLVIKFKGPMEVVTSSGSLLCGFGEMALGTATVLVTSEEEKANPVLKDFSTQARENAKKGPWFSLVHDWKGSWMGWDSIVEGTQALHTLAVSAIETGSGGWGGRLNPNNAGVDRVFGSVFSALLWFQDHLVDPRVLRPLWKDSQLWAKRPIHWLEPGSHKTLRWDPQRAKVFTMHNQQPYSQAEAEMLNVGPQFRGSNGDLVGYDAEHRAVAPLVAATILTGDPNLFRVCDSLLGSELYERSILNGWLQNGRGHGRPLTALSLLARVSSDQELVDAATKSSLDRMTLAKNGSAGVSTKPVWCCRLNNRGSPWGESQYWVPYEQAWAATGHYLEWKRTANPEHLRLAYKFGRGVVAGYDTTQPENTEVAYLAKWLGGDAPGTPGVLNSNAVTASEAFQRWALSGAKVYLLARADMQRLNLFSQEDINLDLVWAPIARKGIVGLEKNFDTLPEGELVCAAHTGLIGTFPELISSTE